ncbi:hypothetical protein GJU40_18135 [Bacillus lacus]|uniref:Uncharacterized protein n=1 Tax=Metabacillus lacus TaxID=1983721 RepID=A0A7X2LYX9_9BACI|nr:hypothetical protein [Metabacillus lacus]MRX74045.1 hypothetical protein [Metabacillus lacus]
MDKQKNDHLNKEEKEANQTMKRTKDLTEYSSIMEHMKTHQEVKSDGNAEDPPIYNERDKE